MPDKTPRSLTEFNYFDDKPPAPRDPDASSEADEALEAFLAARRAQVQRSIFTLVASSTFLVMSIWFMLGYRDAARYAFSPVTAPLELGDAADISPEQITHNAYVRIHGVTEHRGLKQELVRGLTLSKKDYWFFRLLGSRGTFIEVEPDAEHYGTTTEVTVAGRAVDPAKEPIYTELLKGYADIFGTELRAQTRIIQVGVQPGTRKAPYVFALLVLGIVGVANVLAAARVIASFVRRR